MKKLISLTLTVMLVFIITLPNVAFAANTEEISILFTNDMHSHLESRMVNNNGKLIETGGFAKLKTIVDDTNNTNPGTFLFDGGDFSMGTPFQTIYKTDAAELRMMAEIGYDATTFGNHEFDYESRGLAQMLNAARKNTSDVETLPEIVQANIDWDSTLKDAEMKKDAKVLKTAWDKYGVDSYKIIEKDGVKVAVFGIMGDDAIDCAPEAGVKWSDKEESAKAIVNEIKNNGEADLIVCLSHSGTTENGDTDSEDEDLAKAVPDIDLIISGHTHSILDEPITVGDTIIASAGSFTDFVGHVVVEKSGDKVSVKSYELIPLDNKVDNNSAIATDINNYKNVVNSKYMNEFGYSVDQVIAKTSFNFMPIDEFSTDNTEMPLGDLIADAYKASGDKNTTDKKDVDVAIVPAGTIRDTFVKGSITAGDAFNVASLGVGKDGLTGYPLVSSYLTGKELKSVVEIDASISDSYKSSMLYASGIKYSINPKRLFLNRATDIKLVDAKGNEQKIENKKLYKVVSDLYSLKMLSSATDKSYGLISIEPKDKDGKKIKNFEDGIIYENGNEVKAWDSVAEYIDDFKGNTVPTTYKNGDGRKIVNASFSPIQLFKQPNNIAFMLLGIILIPVVIIIGLIIFFVRRRYDRRGYRKNMFSNSKSYKHSPNKKPKLSNPSMNTIGRGKSKYGKSKIFGKRKK